MRIFEHTHIVGFEETNLLGNVYFTNYFLWQGKCREMFLRKHVPELMNDLSSGLYLATSRSNCEFLAEAFVFDEIVVRMKLNQVTQSRITMGFEYVRRKDGVEEVIARGEQQVVCMRRSGDHVDVAEVPANIMRALKYYQTEG